MAGCVKCQKSKADKHSRQTKLVPMLTGERPFNEIEMDFVGELPESEGFNAILVVTDRFTKVQHYIPAKTTRTAENIANSYVNNIWKLHDLQRQITSDHDPQFASKFLKELNRKLNINLRLSTAYHSQTDVLSERAVQTLKQYLRIYCYDRQNRWRARFLLQNLPIIPQPSLPTHSPLIVVSMALLHPPYTSITTMNSPLLLKLR